MMAQIPTWLLVSGGIVFATVGSIIVVMVYGNIGRYSGLRGRFRPRDKTKKR